MGVSNVKEGADMREGSCVWAGGEELSVGMLGLADLPGGSMEVSGRNLGSGDTFWESSVFRIRRLKLDKIRKGKYVDREGRLSTDPGRSHGREVREMRSLAGGTAKVLPTSWWHPRSQANRTL